jgi:hypothetical protein
MAWRLDMYQQTKSLLPKVRAVVDYLAAALGAPSR